MKRLRHTLIACALTLPAPWSTVAMARPSDGGGVATPAPQWSLGIQVGNYNATGFSAQKFGVLGGSVDVTMALGLGSADFGVGIDYIRYLGFGLRPIAINDFETYNSVRDKMLPYFGVGLQADSGLGLRFPMGIQYTLPRHPLTVFGGIALYLGPFMSHRVFGPELWFSLGARLLI